MSGYEPMSLAGLAQYVTAAVDERVQWKLVWEFLEEYRWEPAEEQISLLQAEPQLTGDERWDALLAALAEHLCAQHDIAPLGGRSHGCCVTPGSRPNWPSSGPTRWCGRRRRSVSMASSCPLMT